MNDSITLERRSKISGTTTLLPSSKSISNRVLILQALANSTLPLHNLSDANDTQLMLKRVNAPEHEIDVEDAGTTMRFLTAYFSITNRHKILTGSARMKERPIGILVNALRTLGVSIDYLENEGFPPLRINGFASQQTSTISIRGDVSSQFISALMMVAPVLPNGLTLHLTGKVGSRPYIEMTSALMKLFGVNVAFQENTIRVPHQAYRETSYTVESDWSAASYWYAFAALAEHADITLPNIKVDSLQGDRAISQMTALGVRSEMVGGMLRLTKGPSEKTLTWDFTDCPDLAQTVAVICAAKNITGHFTGLESLRIKETDRIAALQNELRKIGADLLEHNSSSWTLVPSSQLPASIFVNTYKDHRMAMAFAPLSTLMKVEIENPSVVRKSYPRFWDDVKAVRQN